MAPYQAPSPPCSNDRKVKTSIIWAERADPFGNQQAWLKSSQVKSSQVKSSQWQVQVPPCSAALGTWARRAQLHARWRVDIAGSVLGWRTGAVHCIALPTRTRRDIAHCAPAAVPQTGPAHHTQHQERAPRLSSDERALGHPSSTFAPRWLLHAPPAPCSQSSRSTLSSTRMGS